MISVIIVTHDSQTVLGRCIDTLEKQTVKPDSVILIDSGSADRQYLERLQKKDIVTKVLLEDNIGFGPANNKAYRTVDPSSDYVLFLNPDAFPAPDSLEKAVTFFETNPGVGCIGGRLLGYDWQGRKKSDVLDSTGVFRKWYGRWYDRGQGEMDDDRYRGKEEVPAVCGAFLFCRKKVLDQASLAGEKVFDPDFFMYKEDIELCMRIQKLHWRIVYLPNLLVYHCRGWQKRQKIPYQLRLTAAASEILLYKKHPSPYMIWAMVKYVLVRFLRV